MLMEQVIHSSSFVWTTNTHNLFEQMKQFIRLLERHLSGKKVLGLFLLTNSVYLFMLAFTIPTTMAFSKGMKLLDIMPMGYDLNYVKELFSSLGEKDVKPI